ncbi:9671_t:CDS:2 [Acaulospora colombiana]|uniref:9671_t:CDS:1 n=1 Tax=Acaulospora colombiana TaxID=27376 RepID=A0ACA9L7D7_9GLOM|nr:9671_t:CDS:2 [Acaulospora colombiana]
MTPKFDWTPISEAYENLPEDHRPKTRKRIAAGTDDQSATSQNLGSDNRASIPNNDTTERSEAERVLTTEAESEYESSRPGSVISPLTETGNNTESAVDDDLQSTDEDPTETEIENDDTTNDDDEEHEGNATPTRSTTSGVSEANSDEEDPSIGTSTSRSHIRSRAYRRSSSGAGVESDDEQ